MREVTIINSHRSAPLQSQRELLLAKRQKLIQAFTTTALGRRKQWTVPLAQIREIDGLLETLDGISQEPRLPVVVSPDGSQAQRYVVSSLFLHESFRKLTPDEKERFFFVTGAERHGVLFLDQSAEFAHRRRTVLGVTGDQASTHALLIKLEQFGHRLLATAHSHPGKGIGATKPSGTDDEFQRRLESAGHVAIMAIFSRDGFVRFLRHDQNFEIEIYGLGVEKHDHGIYRLVHLD